MATVENDKRQSSMSEEAYELFSCFHSGVDDVVYEIAADVARERLGVAAGEPVDIEKEDVRQAACKLLDAVKHLVASGKATAELEALVGGMGSCFNNKAARI